MFDAGDIMKLSDNLLTIADSLLLASGVGNEVIPQPQMIFTLDKDGKVTIAAGISNTFVAAHSEWVRKGRERVTIFLLSTIFIVKSNLLI